MDESFKSLIILVTAHRSCSIPKSPYYLPIQVGRSLNETISVKSKQISKNVIADNTGDNISKLNPYFCELTAIYWAWKNYLSIGNPKRIGFCHYRRFFLDINTNVDIVVPLHIMKTSIEEQFCLHHNAKFLQDALSLITDREILDSTLEYLKQNKGYFFNMFIMKKEYFFDYCQYIFPILFKLFNQQLLDTQNPYQRRMIGFVAERLTGGYIYYLKTQRKLSIHETLSIMPIFSSLYLFDFQQKLVRLLASRIPNFHYIYSRLLSFQTFLNKFF